MRLLQVTDSDVIECIGYEPKVILKTGLLGALAVVFKSTPDIVYSYEDVPATLFIDLVGAESIGKAFHEHFRKNKKWEFTKSQRPPTLKK